MVETMEERGREEKDLYDYERELNKLPYPIRVEKDSTAKDKSRSRGILQFEWNSLAEGTKLFRGLLRGLQRAKKTSRGEASRRYRRGRLIIIGEGSKGYLA
jgi:hypothetical protein